MSTPGNSVTCDTKGPVGSGTGRDNMAWDHLPLCLRYREQANENKREFIAVGSVPGLGGHLLPASLSSTGPERAGRSPAGPACAGRNCHWLAALYKVILSRLAYPSVLEMEANIDASARASECRKELSVLEFTGPWSMSV